jgi:hypothetical protein
MDERLEMDMEEIKKDKIYLEFKLGQLISEFEQKTGTLLGNPLKIRR